MRMWDGCCLSCLVWQPPPSYFPLPPSLSPSLSPSLAPPRCLVYFSERRAPVAKIIWTLEEEEGGEEGGEEGAEEPVEGAGKEGREEGEEEGDEQVNENRVLKEGGGKEGELSQRNFLAGITMSFTSSSSPPSSFFCPSPPLRLPPPPPSSSPSLLQPPSRHRSPRSVFESDRAPLPPSRPPPLPPSLPQAPRMTRTAR